MRLSIGLCFVDLIIYSFAEFLRTYENPTAGNKGSDPYYLGVIRSMCNNNRQSFEVSFLHLAGSGGVYSQIGDWLMACPDILIDYLNEVFIINLIHSQAAKRVVLEELPTYEEIHKEIYIRFRDVSIMDKIRDLRSTNLGKLIRTQGVVTRRTGVFPQMLYVAFRCPYCKSIMDGIKQVSSHEVKPDMCLFCQRKGLEFYSEKTVYRNYQKMTIQESPGTVPAGRIPRSKVSELYMNNDQEVILTGDLIDCARPGDEIDLTGRYTNNFDTSLNTQNGFPVFSTVIEANNVTLRKDVMGNQALSQDDIHAVTIIKNDQIQIQELAADPAFEKRLLCSIAPFIFGHEDVKMAIALALFGGQQDCSWLLIYREKVNAKHRIRGDINVLLMGDPGTAKSQFLKYAERTSPRAVYDYIE